MSDGWMDGWMDGCIVCEFATRLQTILDSNDGDMLFLIQKLWMMVRFKPEWSAKQAKHLMKKVRALIEH